MLSDYQFRNVDGQRSREPRLGTISLALVALLVILLAAIGPPPFTVYLPTALDTELLLRSPGAEQLTWALAVASWAAWLIWAWLALTLALRVFVVLCEQAAAGAAWVVSLRTISNRLTLPVVRRAVDASLAGLLLARVAGGSVAGPPLALAEAQNAEVRLLNPAPVEASRHGELLPGNLLYTVQTGDSLGKIAERYYGDWAAYERIFEANRQRRQQDGRLLEDARAIYPGWTLIIPGPTDAVKPDADGQLWCVTQPGDNLSGIAARLLGNAHRWPEVFELNRGVAQLPDGRTLTNPELVWPGLRLRLPDLNSATAPAPDEGGRAALEVSGSQTVGTNTPVRTVATYYQLLAQGDFAGAAELMRDGPLAWREASARQMPESRLPVRRATVLSMDPYEREATVAVELEAGAESGTPQRVLVTWQLARGPEGWRLVSADVGPSM